MNSAPETIAPQATALVTPESMLKHWQGHRSITRKTIEMFPEEHLFTFQPAPPMRSFGALMIEVLGLIEPTVKGVQISDFSYGEFGKITSKAALLEAWDANTITLDAGIKGISSTRWLEVVTVYGSKQSMFGFVDYLLENEIHHRSQGYVYLRLLGLEPPFFHPM